MRSMNATRFKAQCLRILDEVARTGETVAISKRGRVVAEVVPPRAQGVRYPQESLRGKGRTVGDVVAPTTPAGNWGATRGKLA
jgi:antitoxin (DNA-binding transcriptional repressor) of toxin-antitoxin stability system